MPEVIDRNGGDAPRRLPGPLLVDAHVHLRECFDPVRFLNGAARNVRRAAGELDLDEVTGCLLFAETEASDAFARLHGAAGRWPTSGRRRPTEGLEPWQMVPTREDISVVALGPGGERLLLVAGRQFDTAERIEMLALGTRHAPARSLPLAEAVPATLEAGAIPVVAWGFGKWWFARGRTILAFLDARPPAGFFLGDNAGRPRPAPRSRILTRARRAGIAALPGSDPLPLPRASADAGRFGFVLEGDLDAAMPAADLLGRLRRLHGQPRTFGRRTGPWGFARDQVALWRSRASER